MAEKKRCFAVLTGGGDCPGLNAVIASVVKTFLNNGAEVYGVLNGFNGLVMDKMKKMDYASVSGIMHRGGTILGTTNRDNPFKFAEEINGEIVYTDRREQVVANLKKYDIEALVVIGGDGSMNIGAQLARECGIKVVGCPKTIDNDLACTERTFGFDTAVAMASEALDRLHSTAESHHRVMALEVMGRYAGWIALHAGIAGGADIILIPEIPYQIENIIKAVKHRNKRGRGFTIIAVAEGAKSIDDASMTKREYKKRVEEMVKIYPSISYEIADQIKAATGLECRVTVPGHMQRGGQPNAYDRVLSSRRA